MPDGERKKTSRPEIFFLPPLKMVLAFFDRDSKKNKGQKKVAEGQKETDEKNVEKLIEKLSEKDK